MAQSEDTELRDLVIEALEKSGSLAKIRALLRANIFLAFEDDYESIRQNVTLDSVLKVPEGILALSIVHEFLEFCNLKNTLFVYKSETRQEREYKYEGQKKLREKLNIKPDASREPVLVSIVKFILKPHQRQLLSDNNTVHGALKNDNPNYKDDQNCTYIVHDDSTSTTSQSHSDNSSDEKTKLHLRLQLDNSDTDTSSDSVRDKSSSEYIPNAHILHPNEDHTAKDNPTVSVMYENEKNLMLHSNQENTTPPYFLNELKIVHNSSSDSTSYAELKPFNLSEDKLLNTTGIPISSENKYNSNNPHQSPKNEIMKTPKNDDETKNNSSLNSLSHSTNKENGNNNDRDTEKKSQEISAKSDSATAEYSYDFSLSGESKNKGINSKNLSPQLVQEDLVNDNLNKNTLVDSPRDSHSSRSSISISDVADLISEKSVSLNATNNDIDLSINKIKLSSHNLSKSPRSIKSPSNDSGDFSESPVPSLSNLSLDIHSE